MVCGLVSACHVHIVGSELLGFFSPLSYMFPLVPCPITLALELLFVEVDIILFYVDNGLPE